MRGDVDEADGSVHKVHIYKFSFVQAPTVAKFTVVVAVVGVVWQRWQLLFSIQIVKGVSSTYYLIDLTTILKSFFVFRRLISGLCRQQSQSWTSDLLRLEV